MSEKFYVYIYLDPRKSGNFTYQNMSFSFKPFYVGKGKNTRHLEFLGHCGRCLSTVKAIKKINLNPISIMIRSNISEQEAFDLEKQLIKEIGRSDLGLGPLTNLTEGGEGSCGLFFTKDHKDKLSKSHIGQISWNKGKCLSQETKEKLHDANLGKHHSKETVQKISKSLLGEKNHFYGKKHSNSTIEKMSLSHRDRLFSEDHKRKISESQKLAWIKRREGMKISNEHYLSN